jgi:hypothetical protein
MAGRDQTRRVVAALAPPLGAATIALAMLVAAPRPAPARRPAISAARLEGTRPDDCVPCHAREVAEWRGSAMAMAVRSPLVGALESLVEEQVGRDSGCPEGAGVLRARGAGACVDAQTGITVTGAGGEGWCVNCHAPGENLAAGESTAALPPWRATGGARSREPLRDVLSLPARDGVSCAVCHSTIGPVPAHAVRARGYEGNATWTSIVTGRTFLARPEDGRGVFGIANAGYRLDAQRLLGGPGAPSPETQAAGGARLHPAPSEASVRYLESSEFCGACHDVRLFGTDVRGAARGEHFKRLRNAYSEWRAWADAEARAGRTAPSCQDCHMSLYPSRPPGTYAEGFVAPSSPSPSRLYAHWFTGVEIPLSSELPDAVIEDATVDGDGVPVGVRARRDQLLRAALRLTLGEGRRQAGTLEVPLVLENVGAGHRVPAGFSQERETWVELEVLDARGKLVYSVGGIDRPDADLADKVLVRVTTSDARTDARGRPLGLFGADVVAGPDAPAWAVDSGASSPRSRDVTGPRFRGAGLINLQNGFVRCVRCIGIVDAAGRCQPGPGQGVTRADRFADGDYDLDTGECRSNLAGDGALFETFFPVGSLDADRGVLKAPDAIVDTRSAAPGVPLTYTYVLDTRGRPAPFTVRARLMFRAFPPYLVRAFAAYERAQARAGRRPSGPQVDEAMLRRDDPVELARVEGSIK